MTGAMPGLHSWHYALGGPPWIYCGFIQPLLLLEQPFISGRWWPAWVHVLLLILLHLPAALPLMLSSFMQTTTPIMMSVQQQLEVLCYQYLVCIRS